MLQEEMRGIDDCDLEEFGTLLIGSREKTIDNLGDRLRPQAAKQEGGEID